MQSLRTMPMVATLLAVLCFVSSGVEETVDRPAQTAAEKPALSATVVGKDGTKVELRAFWIESGSSGLFGSSSTKLDALPVKISDMQLDVPLDNLTKIEVISAEKTEKAATLRLTSDDGTTLVASLDADKKVKWKGTHPFADSQATFDLTAVKEIVLGREAN